MKKTLLILFGILAIALIIFLPKGTRAQVSGSLWKLSANQLLPVNSSWGVTIPSLGGSGTGCVGVNNSGVFSFTSCGSGGSAFPFTPTSYGNSTSTTIGFLNGLLSNGSTTVTGTLHTDNQIITTGSTLQFTGYSSLPQIYAGDSTTGLHFDGPGIFSIHNGGNQTVLFSSTNRVGIASSSPIALLSLHGSSINSFQNLFQIGSSTASATTTLFNINNKGDVLITGSTTVGSIFQGGGLTTCTGTSALTYNGTAFTCTAQPQGTVTSVTGTWPIISSGGATPNLTFGWATTSQPSSSNLYVSNGSNGFYGVATSTATLGLGLSGSIVGLGSSNSLSIATSSLYSGAAEQIAYFSGTNTLMGTSTIAIDTTGYVGIATATPSAQLAVEMGTENYSFTVGNQGSTSPAFAVRGVNGNGQVFINATAQVQSAQLTVGGSINTSSGISVGSGPNANIATDRASFNFAQSNPTVPGLSLSGNSGTMTASTEQNNFYIQARTATWSAGNITIERHSRFGTPTLGFAVGAASTITDAATLSIDGTPLVGTRGAITNSHALLIQSSALNASTTNAYGLTVNASTGATNNYAAQFLGGNVGIGSSSPFANLSIDAPAGQNTFAIGSTTSTLAWWDVLGKFNLKDIINGWTGIVTPTRAITLNMATTTTWTATSSNAYVQASSVQMPFAGTLKDVSCNATSTGAFLNVMPYLNQTLLTPSSLIASTTKGTVAFTANNTFSVGDVLSMYVGTSTASTANIGVSCTFRAIQTN